MNALVSAPPPMGALLDDAPRRAIAVEAALAAVAMGVLYTLSPMTVWMMAVIAIVIGWAAHGLGRTERRWVVGLLVVSVALRAIAIASIAWRNNPNQHSFSTIFGDAQYAIRVSLWIRNTFLDIPIDPRDYVEVFDIEYGRTSYHTILAVLQVWLGPSPYGVHVLSVALYLVGVVALYRTARSGYGPAAAMIGLATVLFLPSLFLWSILPLKESMYFSFTAILISALASLRRCRNWSGVGAALTLFAGALVGIGSLRTGGLVIAVGGLVLGLAAWVAVQRRSVLLVLLPTLAIAAVWIVGRPAVQDRILATMRQSLPVHLGHVRTPGTNYKLVSREFYRGDRPVESLEFEEGVVYLARSVAAFVLVPKPWAPAARSEIYLAPQQIAWYGLVVCALLGAMSGLRRDPLLTCLLAGNVVVGVIVIAPNSGNVGTLIRHRDMVVPFLVWLSSAGLLSAVAGWGAAGLQRRIRAGRQ